MMYFQLMLVVAYLQGRADGLEAAEKFIRENMEGVEIGDREGIQAVEAGVGGEIGKAKGSR